MSFSDDDSGTLRAPGFPGFHISTYGALIAARTADINAPHTQWRDSSAITIERMLAHHLRTARKRAQLPQWAVAERMGRAQSFIAKLERPTQHLHVYELVQLCVVLQRCPGELLSAVVNSPGVREVMAPVPPLNRVLR